MSEVVGQGAAGSEVPEVEDDGWEDSCDRFTQMMKEKRERDAISELASAERKGFKKGLRRGRRIGFLKGLKEGIIYKSRIEMAQKMLQRGMDVATIADISELSEDEIRRLC